MSEPEAFVNFGTDKKGDWARCTNLKCRALYRDWNASANIARCPKCRSAETKK